MKIAHIVCAYPPYFGGMGNVVFQMAQELVNQGHEVEVLTPLYAENKEIRSKEAAPAETHAPQIQETIDYAKRMTPSLEYGNAARLPNIGGELDEFDVVHLHYPFFGTANLVRKWKLRNPEKPLVITYHMDTRAPSWKGLVFKWYAKYWMPKILGVADAIIASTFDYVEHGDASVMYQKTKEKWYEIPFGVDTERFFPAPKPLDLFVRHSLRSTFPTVLFVGGMDTAHYFKGVPVLLQALSLLKNKGVEIQAVLVGNGDLRSNYEMQAKALGLGDLVRFVGRVEDDELPRYYNMADLFVFPSTERNEAFGLVLLEAMASGVPVLASDLPGVRTVAEQGGFTVPAKNSVALAQSIQEYFVDREGIEHWKQQARESAEQLFSWPMIVAATVDLYTSLQKD